MAAVLGKASGVTSLPVFSVSEFLACGTFFRGVSSETHVVRLLQQQCDRSFGIGVPMYYFDYAGYSIEFICGEDTYRPKGEQIEVYAPELVLDAALCSILTVEKFNLSPLKHSAIEEYSDGDEYVIFLRNGLNLYYLSNGEQGFFLAKIISQHEPSRILVRKTMASAR